MRGHYSRLRALLVTDPARARALILDVATRCDGHKGRAARALDVSGPTFWRVVKQCPGLSEAIEQLAVEGILRGSTARDVEPVDWSTLDDV